MASAILCQSCGIEAPTRHVSFNQNIGMLVMRTHRRMKGNLCKQCVQKHFLKMTGTTLFLGPWGTISLILAPCFIIGNVASYLGSLGMPAVPAGACVPQLTADAVANLKPHTAAIVDRMNRGEPLDVVATSVAADANVTPGQVVKYVIALSQQNRPQKPTYGFPVQPLPTQAQPMPVEMLSPDAQV